MTGIGTDSTVELKFIVEVCNTEAGHQWIRRYNLGRHGLKKMKENRQGYQLKKILNNDI